MQITKSRLAIVLSRLQVFQKAQSKTEQYPMDSEVGSAALWNAYMNHDITDKSIADLGCGTGLLGIGCLLLGAKQVFFIDNHQKALNQAKENLQQLDLASQGTLKQTQVQDFNRKVDVVMMNPPFGTKQKHADRAFLEHAFKLAKVVYSFHKLESEAFLRSFSKDHGFTLTHRWSFNFPIKQTMEFHRKRIHRFQVGCFRFEKETN